MQDEKNDSKGTPSPSSSESSSPPTQPKSSQGQEHQASIEEQAPTTPPASSSRSSDELSFSNDNKPRYLVAIGASAGGLEALERLLEGLPDDTGAAFVIIQHLSPDFKSLLGDLLSRRARMPVINIEQGQPLAPNTVYLIPPGKEVELRGSFFLLRDRQLKDGINHPINIFFSSAAAAFGKRTIGIVLSGTGSDGTNGVRDIHEAGGLVVVQDHASAKFSGMPHSALATGIVDSVATPWDIPNVVLRHIGYLDQQAGDADGGNDEYSGFGGVYALLNTRYNLDFKKYKSTTVMRRIHRRMKILELDTPQLFSEHLQQNPDEVELLYQDLLIGVTQFFRDEDAFERLREHVIPALFDEAVNRDELRVWVAGCASGEEAYSIAILLYEEAVKRQYSLENIKIFATDVHHGSLKRAANGIYSEAELAKVSPSQREAFFTHNNQGWQVKQTLRNMIVFATHNMLSDPPFTNMDLISCRNVLIYLLAESQATVLSTFHFALRNNGYLFLGSSEQLGMLDSRFETLDRKEKVFIKKQDMNARYGRMLPNLRPRASRPTPNVKFRRPIFERNVLDVTVQHAYDSLLSRYVPTSFLVDQEFNIIHVFGDGGKYLRHESGKMAHDIISLTTGDLRAALNAGLHKLARTNEEMSITGIRTENDPNKRLSLRLSTLPSPSNQQAVMLVTVEEAEARPRSLAEQHTSPGAPSEDEPSERNLDMDEESRRHIDQLEYELSYTREHLQSTIEELAASNEELQATNEEMVVSNEELQSTNEELHSLNEELYTVNAEYQRKIEELTELNSDLNNLLSSTNIGTLFLDNDLKIRKFTDATADIFNLIPQDIGRPITHISSNIEISDWAERAQRVMRTGRQEEEEVTTRQSERTYLLRVSPYRTETGSIEGVVITFTDVTRLREAEDKQLQLQERFQQLADNISVSYQLVALDPQRSIYTSPSFETIWHHPTHRLEDRPYDWLSAVLPEDRAAVERILNDTDASSSPSIEFRIKAPEEPSGIAWIRLQIFPIGTETGAIYRRALLAENITDRKQQEFELRSLQSEREEQTVLVEAIMRTTPDRVVIQNEALEVTYKNDAAQTEEVLPEEPRAQLDKALQQVIEDGQPRAISLQWRDDQGEHYNEVSLTPLLDGTHERVVGVISVSRDLGEQILTERRMLAAEYNRQALLDSVPVPLAIINSESNFQLANEAFTELFKVDPDKAIGKSFAQALGEDFYIPLAPRIEEALSGNEQHFDVRYDRGKSDTRELQFSFVPQRKDEQVYDGFTVIVEDLTEERRSNRDRQRLAEQTQHSQRLESLGALAGGIAHDFNNMLSVTLTYADLGLRTRTEDEGIVDYFQNIKDITKRASQMCHQMLVFSGKGTFENEPFQINEALTDINHLISVTIPEGIDSSFALAEALPPTRGDLNQLQQAVINLTKNAIEAIDGTGEILFETGGTILDEAFCQRYMMRSDLKPGRYVTLSISDTGIGIPEAHLDRVMEPFFSTKFVGRGLGLSTVLATAHAMGGAITVQTMPNAGTTITLFLPTLDGMTLPEPKAPEGALRILIVDDEEPLLKPINRLLSADGFDTRTARNGFEAIKCLRVLPEPLDVALVDISMPGLDGVETARQLRLIQPGLPVLLTSGYASMIQSQGIPFDNITRFAKKPWNNVELIETLRELSGREPEDALKGKFSE